MKKEMTLRTYLSESEDYGDGGFRPAIEYWPDEWAEWVSSHRSRKADEYFCKSGHRSSVFCPTGLH